MGVILRRTCVAVTAVTIGLLPGCDSNEPIMVSESAVSISGAVLDSLTAAPVSDASIVHFFVDPGDSSTSVVGTASTDSTGAYRVVMPYAPYGWLSFEAPGYRQEQHELEQSATQTGPNSYSLNVLLGRRR